MQSRSWSGVVHAVMQNSIGLILMFAPCATVVRAQYFPTLPVPTQQGTNIQPDYSVLSATVPNSVYGTVVMSAYVHGDIAAYSISQDGANYNPSGMFLLSNLPTVGCFSNLPGSCGVAVASFGNRVYLAYGDPNGSLVIATGTPDPSDAGYTFSLLQTFPSAKLSSGPAMAVFQNKLIIMFGSTINVQNGLFQVTCPTVGAQCGAPSSQYTYSASYPSGDPRIIATGVIPGLAVFNNALWMTLQQNNSQHHLFVYEATDGQTWQYVTEVAYPLAAGGGIQMVAYHNSLLLATQQNNSNRNLFLFSSPDGTNWTDQQYSQFSIGGITGASPGLAVIGANVAIAARSNNPNGSGDLLYTAVGH